ncbi:MAG: efflux RND transporter periplasmic adaptor subunit [Candidatus Gastranaerophilales bacterium]|nr:efflux RND transporter periplasmic adaptor subunit [Candidatus Gastranaerophilales bacterium]
MSYLNNKKAQVITFLIAFILGAIALQQWSSYKSGQEQQESMSKAKEVQTMSPEIREIYSQSESAGRIEAKYSVDVVARINGWLQKRFFDEGAMIKKGQTLFLIEPDEYQIAVSNAAAAVRQNEATLINAEKELVRAQELVKNDYVSKSYYDEALATRDKSKAALDAAKAQLANAKLNLGYTKITSPIDGKIGKIIITEGNLVNTSSGALARIVSLNPIYVYFNLKSSEFLKFRKADSSADFSNMNVQIQLADGSIYSEKGVIEFVDNEIDQTTGTISLRATFKNDDGLLVPGDFVKVMVKSESPRTVMLIPQAAALNDSEGYYVWGIEDSKAVRKNIKVSDEIDKNWIVEDGLELDDVIVAKGVQSVNRAGQTVNAQPLNTQAQETTTQEE